LKTTTLIENNNAHIKIGLGFR